ncbi:MULTISPECIES: ATP-binding protein [Rhodomicrobium]|uniref:ATP-binding protein n=1 Tax=Rhodomicrobium TaxID=1068 RepID=UPI000B4AC0BE|nr:MULTISPECIES: ATP-binding protein [Rhodomicrobium]
MSTLRAKIISLLVGAILVVVALATGLTFLMLELERPRFADGADADAAQIGLILGRQGTLPSGAPVAEIGLQPRPAEGRLLHRMTGELRAALSRHHLPADAVVTRPPDSPWPVASIALPGGAGVLVTPLAMPPPVPDMSAALIGWILLVSAGTTAVVVTAVYRLTQPLALVQRSLADIGPHGELPLLAETGAAEVRATARAINLLSSRLKTAMESRMRLVAAAGHDLRTPMTRMRLRAEFLNEPDREKFLADLDELDRIADSAIRLVREEIAEEGRDPVRLDILLREVVAELCELQLDVALTAVEPAEVDIKPLALKRALRNLVINAATHGRGATVSLAAKHGAVAIRIVDRGPGIPEAMLQRAFEPFFRVDPARSAGQGAGLGLAIAKEIIQRNSGLLTLTNAPTGGLVQTIELPAARG